MSTVFQYTFRNKVRFSAVQANVLINEIAERSLSVVGLFKIVYALPF